MTLQQETSATRVRYERIAPFYDLFEAIPEVRYRPWRMRFWKRTSELLAANGQLLEVGVGTGKNIAYWPSEANITAVDISPRMLSRARARASALTRDVLLELGDAQDLQFPDDSFDLAAMTFVMCSVPDAVAGLREVSRVVRPGGYVMLMEHVRSAVPWMGRLMDLLDPLIVRLLGPHINRKTVENVAAAGLELVSVSDLTPGGIFKMIEARVPNHAPGGNK